MFPIIDALQLVLHFCWKLLRQHPQHVISQGQGLLLFFQRLCTLNYQTRSVFPHQLHINSPVCKSSVLYEPLMEAGQEYLPTPPSTESSLLEVKAQAVHDLTEGASLEQIDQPPHEPMHEPQHAKPPNLFDSLLTSTGLGLDWGQFLHSVPPNPVVNVEEEMEDNSGIQLPTYFIDTSEDNFSFLNSSEFQPSAEDKNSDSPQEIPLFEGSNLTVHDCMVSVLTYAQSAHLSGKDTAKLLDLLEILLPQPNNLPKSAYIFKKYFKTNDSELIMYYFCDQCYRSRSSLQDICTICTSPKRRVSYFISCPLEPQLQRLYSGPGFVDKLKYKKERVKQNKDNIEDIFDGSVYKEAEKRILKNDNNISFTWYSDGLQVYVCSTYSVWNCLFSINELPPEERHKEENILIGGLWGGQGKPHPNIFLLPTYHELAKLKNGVMIKPHGADCCIDVCAFLLYCTCDAPAKACFMNMKGHAGYFACSKCLIKGEKSERSANVMVFPHQDELQLRDQKNYEDSLKESGNSKDGSNGVFGPTLLSYMCSVSLIDAMSIDVMHCVYMGNLKALLRLLFDGKYKSQPFSLVEKIAKVNDRLHALNLPHFVQRLPIDVDKCLSYWKASLCRTFLLYLMLVVFQGIMSDKYYDHLKKLVTGVALLNQSSISQADLQRADLLLTEFCKDFQVLYGIRHMSLNLHSLRHLPQCVQESGPLCYTSCFRYEDLNGKMAALVHGTKNAIMQMGSRLQLVTDLPLLIGTVKSQSARELCQIITKKHKGFSVNEKICPGIYVVGGFSDTSIHSECAKTLINSLSLDLTNCRFFYRLYKDGQLFVSESYGRGSRVSSFCRYICKDVIYHGLILTFLKASASTSDKFYVLVQRSSDLPTGIERYVEFVNSQVTDSVSVSCLKCVSYSLVVDEHNYLVDPLNTFELE
ncbi:hypothetical protein FOCC_FOCC006305 [Frankliniella occidentalis]|nr:hypothetical protein FOCC_FOCC006305 [Frankliniella occidentalis]